MRAAPFREYGKWQVNSSFQWNRRESVTALEMYAVIQAREAVFVVEQQCAYQETDGADAHSWHMRLLADGAFAAYARVVEPGINYAEPSIGRVMTLVKFRPLKLGCTLVAEAIAFTEARYPGTGSRIGAQAHLQKFYGCLGFHGDIEWAPGGQPDCLCWRWHGPASPRTARR